MNEMEYRLAYISWYCKCNYSLGIPLALYDVYECKLRWLSRLPKHLRTEGYRIDVEFKNANDKECRRFINISRITGGATTVLKIYKKMPKNTPTPRKYIIPKKYDKECKGINYNL